MHYVYINANLPMATISRTLMRKWQNLQIHRKCENRKNMNSAVSGCKLATACWFDESVWNNF